MKTNMTITNVHPRGFSFAVTLDAGEQVFIPPHLTTGLDLQNGQTVSTQLVPNPKSDQRDNTPWLAVSIDMEQKSEPAPEADAAQQDSISARDQRVYEVICENAYVTAAEIAEKIDMDAKTAGNSANRLFNAGKIAKADVYNRAGQQRASMTLWAESASDFLEG